MVEATRSRGRSDTPVAGAPTPTGRGDRAARVFRRALVIAALLHLPLVPSRLLDWIRVSLFHDLSDYDDADAGAIIPIDTDLLLHEPVVEPPAPPPPPPAPAPPPPGPGTEVVDAGPPPKRVPPATPPVDAGPAPPAPVRDPLAVAGAAGKIAGKDANVQVLVSGRVLRKHELGPWLSHLLLSIPEWHQFFQDSPIDPIRDINHLLITAPRLRGDAAKMVVLLDLDVPAEPLREAVDAIVHRSNGVWLEDAPVTAARARVLGAPRIFAMVPQKHLLAILPGDAADLLPQLKQWKRFPNSTEGVVISLVTPSRPFSGFFPLPETLKWLRLAVTPTADGGVDLAVDAADRSPEEAARHAEALSKEVELRRKLDVLGFTVEIIGPVAFETSGDTIRARTHVSRAQVGRITGFVDGKIAEAYGAPPPR